MHLPIQESFHVVRSPFLSHEEGQEQVLVVYQMFISVISFGPLAYGSPSVFEEEVLVITTPGLVNIDARETAPDQMLARELLSTHF